MALQGLNMRTFKFRVCIYNSKWHMLRENDITLVFTSLLEFLLNLRGEFDPLSLFLKTKGRLNNSDSGVWVICDPQIFLCKISDPLFYEYELIHLCMFSLIPFPM